MQRGSVSDVSLWGGETLCCERLAVEEIGFFGRFCAKLLQSGELACVVGWPSSRGFRVDRDFRALRGKALNFRALRGSGRFESLSFAEDGWAVTRESGPTAPIVGRLETLEVHGRAKRLGDKPLLTSEETSFPQQLRDLWPLLMSGFSRGRKPEGSGLAARLCPARVGITSLL